MVAFYNALDVFAHCSRAEAFALVVPEAMACGVPCVVTDVSVMGEFMGDPTCLVPTQQPELQAAACVRLLTAPSAERTALRNHVRQRITTHYGMSDMTTKLLDVYE